MLKKNNNFNYFLKRYNKLRYLRIICRLHCIMQNPIIKPHGFNNHGVSLLSLPDPLKFSICELRCISSHSENRISVKKHHHYKKCSCINKEFLIDITFNFFQKTCKLLHLFLPILFLLDEPHLPKIPVYSTDQRNCKFQHHIPLQFSLLPLKPVLCFP